MKTIESTSLEMTHEIGRRLGANLAPGDTIALIGSLGAGKTALVQGLAEGAGVPDRREVNSPTFVIVNEYEASRPGGGLRIYHIDTYRLRHSGDLEALGFDEMLAQGAAVIEWADRVEDLLPPDRLAIVLEPTGDTSRRLKCAAGGPRSRELLSAL